MLIGLNVISNGGGVVWAEVAEKVDRALTYICHLNLTASVPEQEIVELTAKVYVSSEHGQKQDVYFKDGKLYKYTYFIPKEKIEIDVMPAEKKYRRKLLSKEDLGVRRAQEIRELIKELLSGKHKKLGHDNIDGVEVEGIEIADPNLIELTSSFEVESMVVQLWVDIKTYLPMLLKSEISGTKGEKVILEADKFRWNVELDANLFEPDIPSDYELME